MNTNTTAPHPSQGELAEQRHLIDPLDHVWEHLADERHPVSTPALSPKREAEIRAFEEDEHRNVLTMGRDLDDLLAEVDRLREWVAELEGENAKLIRWHREDGSALAELATRPTRAEVLREAAKALEARVADVDVDTRTTWAGMDAAYLRALADTAPTGGAR